MESCQSSDEKNSVSDADWDESGDTGTGAPGLRVEEERLSPSPAPRLLDILCNMSGESEHNYKRSSVRIRKLWKSREVIINSHSREAEGLAGGPFIRGLYLFCRGRQALTPWCCQSDPFSPTAKVSVTGKTCQECVRGAGWVGFLLRPSLSL